MGRPSILITELVRSPNPLPMDAPIATNAAENVGGVEAEALIASRGTKSNAKLLVVFATLNAKGMAAGFVAR